MNSNSSRVITSTGILVLALMLGCRTTTSSFENHPLNTLLDSLVIGEFQRLGFQSGLSIAVVQNGAVVFQKDYGYTNIEAGTPSHNQSVYYLASSTKSLMGLAVANLAHQGKIDIDAPIGTYLPQIDWNEIGAADITIRHLLTHQSGLSNEPIDFRAAFSGDYTDTQMIDLLRVTESGDRDFNYTNFGYILAAMAIQEATSLTWQSLLETEVFSPLEMNSTSTEPNDFASDQLALPYSWLGNDGHKRLYLTKTSKTMHPAGGVLSTALDMAKLLQVELTGGLIDGQRIFPQAVIDATAEKQASVDANFFTYHRTGYGLGWYISDYDGDTLIHHFGSFSGFRPHVSFMPAHGIGVVVLSNDTSPLSFNIPDMVANQIYDILLEKDHVAESRQKYGASTEMMIGRMAQYLERERQKMAARPQSPILPLPFYSGIFENREMGLLRVSEEAGRLVANIGNLHAEMPPYSLEHKFRVELVPGSGRVITYLDSSGIAADSLRYKDKVWKRVE